ncbi:MAG TPA: hypothetical protein ENI26_04870 [Methylophaga aminisulfidivorans]|uniref:Uncharacterized protein n=1 Tax=Methylophaga aminisulfidivorans TaxID=230105 RepID=A0A7C2A6L3_9GAMM|nr:hypothetical protein [Methylophaga aminisulfidivorans]
MPNSYSTVVQEEAKHLKFFKYPEPISKEIYSTNVIEPVHRQFKKLTKSKCALHSEV